MISRRIFLVAGIPGLVAARARADVTDFLAAVAAIEKTNRGRLGVCVIDTATGHRLTHRGDERFAMCSTHKALTAGFVWQRVDRGEESLDRQVAYDKSALVAYSPATEKRAGEGMTIGELCRVAITLSDNTAANLFLATLGGPEGFTTRARALGDPITRLDRIETVLNEAAPSDPRDTTTPNAFADKNRLQTNSQQLSAISDGEIVSARRPAPLSYRPEPHKRGLVYKPLKMGVKNSGSTTMRSFGIRFAAMAFASACVCVAAAPASAQLLSHKDLTSSIAITIAQTAIETCKANGYAVSATVVGRNGEIILQVRGDNTGPHTIENSFRKAYTARTFRIPSGELVDRLKADPTLGLIHLNNVIANRGALPIKVGEDVIGAAGASGAPGGEKDEACIKAGLDKVADQLK